MVPCFNEQQVLRDTVLALLARLDSLRDMNLATEDSHLWLVDDGSTDGTWQLIRELHAKDPRTQGLKLTRNFGHQGALLAGLMECQADVVISIDADLQDDDACIVEMVCAYLAGSDVVMAVRDDRSADTFTKRVTAIGYYRLLRLMGVDVVLNHADYRLLSRRALEELRQYPESNLFLRGIVPLLGLRTSMVHYARRARAAGESKYPARRMFSLAWEGVTSFSVAPVRMVSALGFVISLASLGVTFWALAVKLLFESAVPGWTSTVVPMYFLGGVQILCLGVIGEYVGKIYLEAKRRPRYAVEARLAGSSVQNAKP